MMRAFLLPINRSSHAPLLPIDDLLDLEQFAACIRQSSNFRFAWQFYEFKGYDGCSTAGVRAMLDLMIATPELHQFLRDSFENLYDDTFEIQALHAHCRVAGGSDFETILASAAGDR